MLACIHIYKLYVHRIRGQINTAARANGVSAVTSGCSRVPATLSISPARRMRSLKPLQPSITLLERQCERLGWLQEFF